MKVYFTKCGCDITDKQNRWYCEHKESNIEIEHQKSYSFQDGNYLPDGRVYEAKYISISCDLDKWGFITIPERSYVETESPEFSVQLLGQTYGEMYISLLKEYKPYLDSIQK